MSIDVLSNCEYFLKREFHLPLYDISKAEQTIGSFSLSPHPHPALVTWKKYGNNMTIATNHGKNTVMERGGYNGNLSFSREPNAVKCCDI